MSIDEHAVAELLRLADLALSQSSAALLAFAQPNVIVDRDCARNSEVQRQIKAMLVDLPPEPPLTPEREAECLGIIRAALDRRGL